MSHTHQPATYLRRFGRYQIFIFRRSCKKNPICHSHVVFIRNICFESPFNDRCIRELFHPGNDFFCEMIDKHWTYSSFFEFLSVPTIDMDSRVSLIIPVFMDIHRVTSGFHTLIIIHCRCSTIYCR